VSGNTSARPGPLLKNARPDKTNMGNQTQTNSNDTVALAQNALASPAASKCDDAQMELVHFHFTHPTATTVCVAGTFNRWEPESKPMEPLGNGRWQKDAALSPGTYEYCLVVDGRWMPDPLAKETVPNPFGGRNSILTVAISPEAAHLANAASFPLKNAIKQKTRKL